MRSAVAWLAACAACASAPPKDPSRCADPAARAEVQQIQIGWSAGRDPKQAEALANDLYSQCRKGAAMDGLQDRYSDVPGGSIVVGPQARVPYKAAALCLRKNECAVVRGASAFYVLKRID
jgi:hypothetical protein